MRTRRAPSALAALIASATATQAHYVSALTYHQSGGGSISRVAGASGVATFVVNGAPGRPIAIR